MTSTEIGLRKDLPTMYDLPSEYVGEPGLPNEFHSLQPRLLDRTLVLPETPRDRWFSGSDINLYYDARNLLWYKRPDWFLAVGVPRLYEGRDMRQSYVVWQEREVPRLAIEFLSPGTEVEDLGRFYEGKSAIAPDRTPPSKFVVYEQRLRVPHYVVFDRPTQHFWYFQLAGNRYQVQGVGDRNPQIWFSDLQVGLGIWEGTFEEVPGRWLRWCDAKGNWLPTDTERERQQRDRAEAEKSLAEAERDRERAEKEALLAKLRAAGIDLDEL